MSVIDVEAGDTQWTRAWRCDRCGFEVRRALTGRRQLSHDTRAGEVSAWISYDAEEFKGEGPPFADWVRIETCRRETFQPMHLDPPSFHICPTCAVVVLDYMRTICAEPTATWEPPSNLRDEDSPGAFDPPRSA